MSNFDDALERFHQVELEYAGGLANHGPMGAEALESLGHQAKIPAFVDIYAPRLPPLRTGRILEEPEWNAARGQIERSPDWVATFEARVRGGDWRDSVRAFVPPLLPGLFAAAGHGLLRTAHAVRALEREDSPLRRRELALGLAYWSAREQRLPGQPGASGSSFDPEGASRLESLIERWPLVGEDSARVGSFVQVVGRLDDFATFAAAVSEIPLPAPDRVSAFLDAFCREAASLYVNHPGARIAYVHALTIPSALRFLLPHLPEEERPRAAGFAARAALSLHSIFGDPASAPAEDEEVSRMAGGEWDEIRYHAACSIEEHSIKMTEACWREDERCPDPIYRRAGADAALQIGGRGQASVC